jgi:hypothetical protein
LACFVLGRDDSVARAVLAPDGLAAAAAFRIDLVDETLVARCVDDP